MLTRDVFPGVTAIRPEEFEFPSTMTDMDRGTWMLSGSSVMKDGFTLRSGYPCDLDTLPVGSRIGNNFKILNYPLPLEYLRKLKL